MSITKIIKDYLHSKGMTQKELADLLKESQQNLNKKFRKADLDTGYVLKISTVLNHDFFYDLSKMLRHEVPTIPSGSVEEEMITYGDKKDAKYMSLLEENLQLHRDLKAYRDQMDHFKSGGAAAIPSQLNPKKRKVTAP